MRTLYLRNVPDDVVERLERLATTSGMSLGALAVRELSEASRRADNALLLGSLKDIGVPSGLIVAEIELGRDDA